MPVPPVETISDALRPLTERPGDGAVLCDIDGTLAPIVTRAEEAAVPDTTSRLLARIARRYRVVACISGRAGAYAQSGVGVPELRYVGNHGLELEPAADEWSARLAAFLDDVDWAHGAELLLPSQAQAELVPAFATWADRVRGFALDKDSPALRMMRVRIEDKGAIVAFHWRGARDEDAARTAVEAIAAEAEGAGLWTHWGRKVLEVRPPVPIDKGQAVRELLRRTPVRAAIFGGDDATDLDVYDTLSELLAEGALDAAICVGVRSDEGPAAIVERADLVVDGTPGFAQVLAVLAG